GEVFCSDHHGHKKVAQDGGNRGDQEKEDHHLAVHGEELVVGVRLHQVPGGSQQLEADKQRKEAADEKEERDRDQIEQGDALVVGGEKPRSDAVLLIQIIFPLDGSDDGGSHTHCT